MSQWVKELMIHDSPLKSWISGTDLSHFFQSPIGWCQQDAAWKSNFKATPEEL